MVQTVKHHMQGILPNILINNQLPMLLALPTVPILPFLPPFILNAHLAISYTYAKRKYIKHNYLILFTFEVEIEDIVEIRSLVELQLLTDLFEKLFSHPAHNINSIGNQLLRDYQVQKSLTQGTMSR